MAASLVIEQEWGTSTGRVHPHNSYWAGDFADPRLDAPQGGCPD
jgi:hypothetical protein